MASSLTFDRNPEFGRLPGIEIGDLVILHAQEHWQYKVRAVVTDVDGETVNAEVDAIFDRNELAELTGGEVLALVGKTLHAQRQNIFDVLKQSR